MKIWNSIDRWGPGVISLLSIFALIYYGWITDQRIARLEGMVQARLQMESDLRSDFQLWQSYCASLEKSMIEFGVKVPKFPGKLKGSTDIISSTTQKGEK